MLGFHVLEYLLLLIRPICEGGEGFSKTLEIPDLPLLVLVVSPDLISNLLLGVGQNMSLQSEVCRSKIASRYLQLSPEFLIFHSQAIKIPMLSIHSYFKLDAAFLCL